MYFLVVWLFAIIVIPFVISLFSQPIYWTKYTIAASAALYLIVAKGITNINYRYARLAVVIVIVALSAANLQAYYTTPSDTMQPKPQSREAVGFVNENAKDGDLVLLYPGSDNVIISTYYGFVPDLNVPLFPTAQGNTSTIKELQSDVNGHNHVWLVEETQQLVGSEPEVNQTMHTLLISYNETYHKSYIGYEVYLFEKRA